MEISIGLLNAQFVSQLDYCNVGILATKFFDVISKESSSE